MITAKFLPPSSPEALPLIQVSLGAGDYLASTAGPLDTLTVPADPGNAHYAELMSLVETGVRRNAVGLEEGLGYSLEIEPADPLPNPEDAVPEVISDGQFFTQLALDGEITEEEALASSDGTIPTPLREKIDLIPDLAARFKVTMKVRTATTFERNHPYTLQLGQLMGWSQEKMNTLWRNASKL